MQRLDSQHNNSQTLFIIEGFNQAQRGWLDLDDIEITNAINLAKKYKVQLQDTICNLDAANLSSLLSQKDEDSQKLMVLCLIKLLSQNNSTQNIYDLKIKPAYRKLCEIKKIENMPDWVTYTEGMSYHKFYAKILKDIFENDKYLLQNSMQFMTDSIIEYCNNLSALNTMQFLEMHPEISSIYVLVQPWHFDFLLQQEVGRNVSTATEHYRHSTIHVGDYLIEVQMFGYSKKLKACESMEEKFKKNHPPRFRDNPTLFQNNSNISPANNETELSSSEEIELQNEKKKQCTLI